MLGESFSGAGQIHKHNTQTPSEPLLHGPSGMDSADWVLQTLQALQARAPESTGQLGTEFGGGRSPDESGLDTDDSGTNFHANAKEMAAKQLAVDDDADDGCLASGGAAFPAAAAPLLEWARINEPMAWALFEGLKAESAQAPDAVTSRSVWSVATVGAEAALDARLRQIHSPAALWSTHREPGHLNYVGGWLDKVE